MSEIITHLDTSTPRISRAQITVLVVSIIANIALGVFALGTPLTGAALKSDASAAGKNCDPEFGCAGDLDKAVATQAASNDTSGTGIFSSIGNGMKSVGNTISNAMGQTGISDNNLVNGATRIIGDTGVGALTGTVIAAASDGNIKEAAITGGATMGGLSLVNQALSGGTGNSITGSALGAVGIGTGGGGLVDTLSNTFSGNKSASAATAEPPCVLDTKGQPLTIPASAWGGNNSTIAQPLAVGI